MWTEQSHDVIRMVGLRRVLHHRGTDAKLLPQLLRGDVMTMCMIDVAMVAGYNCKPVVNNQSFRIINMQARTHTCTHTHTHIHFTDLWTLSGITRVGRHQNQSGFY